MTQTDDPWLRAISDKWRELETPGAGKTLLVAVLDNETGLVSDVIHTSCSGDKRPKLRYDFMLFANAVLGAHIADMCMGKTHLMEGDDEL